MTRILYIITSTTVGGTERALLEICRRLDRRRYEAAVLSLKKEGPVAEELRRAGTEVFSLGMREGAGWYSALEFLVGLRRLPGLLGGRDVHILHSFLSRANLFARFAAPRLGRPMVVNAVRTSEETRGLVRYAEERSLQRTDIFCTLSAGLSRQLQERFPIPADRIRVIPNGIDTAAIDPLLRDRNECRKDLSLSPADLVYAAVGRLCPQKGYDLLLEAFRPVFLEHPRALLLVAGEGPERGGLERRARELRIDGAVRFLGLQPSPWTVLRAADVFVLPSRHEGMPNALLEAMAAGLPFAAASVGAVPEMAEHEGEGLIVPPGDPGALAASLDRLAWSVDRRRAMGERGRRTVEDRFSMGGVMASLAELYEELLLRPAP